MCGIAGIIAHSPPTEKKPLLRRMLGLIRHRGPDAFGVYVDDQAGLGSARLSILDLAGGDQPIHNEDKSVWIVYNGEVFNYPDLRAELEQKGHKFYTRTDTEVLVHLYEDLGTDFLPKLNGQFAFAIWDRREQRLMLARDRMGIRPLFYHLEGGRLLFGSEIKTLFAEPSVSREMDLQTLSDIFTCWSPLGSATAFKGVHQLLPGHYAVYRKGRLETRPYWRLSFSGTDDGERPFDAYREELSALLYDATEIRLRADVPVGAYLSGGLDSTYVTALVKKHFNNRLRTFSVSFSDEKFDEAPFQLKAVDALGTDHSMIRCTERDIGENLPGVIWHTEVPMTRTAPVPLYMLSGLVRENNFKVVLTGEGSDEIFAGYDIFKEDRVRRFWAREPESALRPLLLKRLYPDIFSSDTGRAGAFLTGFFKKGLSRVGSRVYSHLIRWENTAQIKTFFSDGLQEQAGTVEEFVNRFTAMLPEEYMRWDPLSRAQYTEIAIFLSNYLLSSQGDRVAMGHSVEGRFPFLDYRVVEFGCSLPPRHRLHVLKDKFVLRKAAEELIPPELALRPKQPYRAPISRCFMGRQAPEYVEELLSPEALRTAGYFNPDKVGRLVDKCRKQDGALLSERENMAVIGIISTQLLHHQFIKNFPALSANETEKAKIFVG
ncbi:MAG TPA: asparagine synthase (glutamine-hydrolyzing) [Deltaproteobacteria bacterium]|nr:asparagine synthase (glutamine-hydrolyzing) [Deltaproteobacteria bacterium]